MDFAPYQSSPPEHVRGASPDFTSANQTTSPRASFSPQARSPPPLHHPQPQRGWAEFDGHDRGWSAAGGSNGGGQYQNETSAAQGSYAAAEVSEFDTSLGIRLDYEACLAYVALPPLGAIILLILERNSDYVRFHAWQSALLFTAIMVFHLVFSWSSFLSWFIFIGDLVLIAMLTMKAYRDAEILDRFEVPFFGRIASNILDDE